MVNNHYPYLFRNVSEEDYVFLKTREPEILKNVKRDLRYKEWATPREIVAFNRNKPSFGYNSRRHILGIFLKEGHSKRLILSREDFDLMSNIEKKIFSALRNVLEESLEGIQMRKEDWK